MNADTFNALYEVGIPVFAYPGARPEDDPSATRLVTRTRSRATVLGGHTAVVWVDGESSCIALTHVDVVSEDEWLAANLAAADTELDARPKPAREKVAGLQWWSVPSGTDEEAKERTNQLLDELTAEARSAAFAEAAAFFDGLAAAEKDPHGYRARVMRGAANDIRRLDTEDVAQ